ncbi:MAG: four helix bundle protein [Planctomycetes bacterium]|nr:four helix bundle protein [Planctomycetota bacterium]
MADSSPGRHISNQLLRAGTSACSNYEEARGAESRADFIHKLRIVLKEIREALFWLKLTQKSEILSEYKTDGLIDETKQLSKIIAKSIITANEHR